MLRGKTRWIILVNIALSICVLSTLYFNFYKKRVVIDVNIGSEPKILFDMLGRNNLDLNKSIKAIFVFKSRPTLTSLENIDKLYHLYKEDIDFCAIFSSRFRLSRDFHVPHGFLIRYKFILISSIEAPNNLPSFLLISGNKIILVDRLLELFQLAKILEWKLHPATNNNVQFSREDLRSILLGRLKKEQLDLLDINTRHFRSLGSLLSSSIDEIYIVHATCSGCELNKVLLNIGDIREKKPLIILSVHANSYEIEALLKSQNTKASVFIDYYDSLGLLHTDLKENFNLFTFNRGEILR